MGIYFEELEMKWALFLAKFMGQYMFSKVNVVS